MAAPPGGLWFWEDGDHLVSTPSDQEAIDQIRAILVEKGDKRSPSDALAEYMCPRMPRGFCMNFTGPSVETTRDLIDRALPYASRNLAMANIIQTRLDRCASCPMCRHDTCISCRRIAPDIYALFGGRRPSLPADRKSGVCKCAGTYAMAVASVLYSSDEQTWEGTPTTCWRFT